MYLQSCSLLLQAGIHYLGLNWYSDIIVYSVAIKVSIIEGGRVDGVTAGTPT